MVPNRVKHLVLFLIFQLHGFGKYGNRKRTSKIKIEDTKNNINFLSNKCKDKPHKIIVIEEENDNSVVDISTAEIKGNINPTNEVHCTTVSVPSNKGISVVTVTSTSAPISIQTIPITMISSSKDFPVTTLSSAVKVSTSKNIQTPIISASGSTYLNENNTSDFSSSSTMTSHFVSVVQSAPLETSSNILQKASSSSTSSLNAIPNSNSTGSSSSIETIPSSTTSRINDSTMYGFVSSYALSSSVAKTDAQTSSAEFSNISSKLLVVTSCNKIAPNITVHDPPVGIIQTHISPSTQNGSSISLSFTSQSVTSNIPLMKNIPALIPLDNASQTCSTQSYKLPSSSAFTYSAVSETVNTLTLKTQLAASVMSSNIEKVLNGSPVTSNFQNLVCTATTTLPNTINEMQSKESSAIPIHTYLAPVLSSNITTIKPISKSSLPTAIFSAKENVAETTNQKAIKAHNIPFSQTSIRNHLEFEESKTGKTVPANGSKENEIMSSSKNQSSSSRNQSNSCSSQHCISSILAQQYSTQPSHSNVGPTLQSFSGFIPKSGITAIYRQDVKLDNSAEIIRKNKNLLPFVTSQVSQRIERSPLRCKWDDLSVTSQQVILKALQKRGRPLKIIPSPTFTKTSFFSGPIFSTSGMNAETKDLVSVTPVPSVFAVTVNQLMTGVSQSSPLYSPPEKVRLLDTTQPTRPETSNTYQLSTTFQFETKIIESQDKPRLLSPANMEVKTEFSCEVCAKMFPHKQSLLLHKRTCNVNKKDNPELEFKSACSSNESFNSSILSGIPQTIKGVDMSVISSRCVDLTSFVLSSSETSVLAAVTIFTDMSSSLASTSLTYSHSSQKSHAIDRSNQINVKNTPFDEMGKSKEEGKKLEATMESENQNENKDGENTSNTCSYQVKGIDFSVESPGQEPLLTQTKIDYLLQESDYGAYNVKDDHFNEDVVRDTLKHLIGDSTSGERDNVFSLLSSENISKEDTRKSLAKESSNLLEEGLCLSVVKEQKEECSSAEKKVSVIGTKALDPVERSEDLKHLGEQDNEKNKITLSFKCKSKRKQKDVISSLETDSPIEIGKRKRKDSNLPKGLGRDNHVNLRQSLRISQKSSATDKKTNTDSKTLPQLEKTVKTPKGRSTGRRECSNLSEEFVRGKRKNLTPPKEVRKDNVSSIRKQPADFVTVKEKEEHNSSKEKISTLSENDVVNESILSHKQIKQEVIQETPPTEEKIKIFKSPKKGMSTFISTSLEPIVEKNITMRELDVNDSKNDINDKFGGQNIKGKNFKISRKIGMSGKERNDTDSCQSSPMSSTPYAESFGDESVAYELPEGTSYYGNKMSNHIDNPVDDNLHVIETSKNIKEVEISDDNRLSIYISKSSKIKKIIEVVGNTSNSDLPSIEEDLSSKIERMLAHDNDNEESESGSPVFEFKPSLLITKNAESEQNKARQRKSKRKGSLKLEKELGRSNFLESTMLQDTLSEKNRERETEFTQKENLHSSDIRLSNSLAGENEDIERSSRASSIEIGPQRSISDFYSEHIISKKANNNKDNGRNIFTEISNENSLPETLKQPQRSVLTADSKDIIHDNISKTSLRHSVKVSDNDVTRKIKAEDSSGDSRNLMQTTEEQENDIEKALKGATITQLEDIDPELQIKSTLQGKKNFNKSFLHEETVQGKHSTRILRSFYSIENPFEKNPLTPTQLEDIDPELQMKSTLQGKKLFHKSFLYEKPVQGQHSTRTLKSNYSIKNPFEKNPMTSLGNSAEISLPASFEKDCGKNDGMKTLNLRGLAVEKVDQENESFIQSVVRSSVSSDEGDQSNMNHQNVSKRDSEMKVSEISFSALSTDVSSPTELSYVKSAPSNLTWDVKSPSSARKGKSKVCGKNRELSRLFTNSPPLVLSNRMRSHSEIKVVSDLSRRRKKIERKSVRISRKSISLQTALNIKRKNRSGKERLINKRKSETKKKRETNKKQKDKVNGAKRAVVFKNEKLSPKSEEKLQRKKEIKRALTRKKINENPSANEMNFSTDDIVTNCLVAGVNEATDLKFSYSVDATYQECEKLNKLSTTTSMFTEETTTVSQVLSPVVSPRELTSSSMIASVNTLISPSSVSTAPSMVYDFSNEDSVTEKCGQLLNYYTTLDIKSLLAKANTSLASSVKSFNTSLTYSNPSLSDVSLDSSLNNTTGTLHISESGMTSRKTQPPIIDSVQSRNYDLSEVQTLAKLSGSEISDGDMISTTRRGNMYKHLDTDLNIPRKRKTRKVYRSQYVIDEEKKMKLAKNQSSSVYSSDLVANIAESIVSNIQGNGNHIRESSQSSFSKSKGTLNSSIISIDGKIYDRRYYSVPTTRKSEEFSKVIKAKAKYKSKTKVLKVRALSSVDDLDMILDQRFITLMC